MALTHDNLAHLLTKGIDKHALALDTLIELLDVDYFTHISKSFFGGWRLGANRFIILLLFYLSICTPF